MLDLFDNTFEFQGINQFEKELSELKSITENYQNLLETLKVSESKYRFLTENSADIVWHLDSDFKFTYVSPSDQVIRGFKQEEVIGSKLWGILTPEGIDTVKKSVEQRAHKKSAVVDPVRYELEVVCKDGSYMWMEINVNPIINKDGVTEGYNGISRDITERKKFEEEIQSKNKELNDLIAHDLRSPFQGLLGVSHILATEIDTLSKQETKDYAVMLYASLSNQFKLLEDLLSWARIQSGKMKYEPVVFNVKEELENVTQMFQSNLKNKNISLNIDASDDLVLFADRDMFWLLIRNLIANAIKVTAKGGKIGIFTKDDIDSVEFEVRDNGVGIEEEDVPKLFQLSSHFTTEGTENESGTGLGLILCKEIIDKHNCKIWVESELGEGSSFKFTMPKINHA